DLQQLDMIERPFDHVDADLDISQLNDLGKAGSDIGGATLADLLFIPCPECGQRVAAHCFPAHAVREFDILRRRRAKRDGGLGHPSVLRKYTTRSVSSKPSARCTRWPGPLSGSAPE